MQKHLCRSILLQNPWYAGLPSELADSLLSKSKIKSLASGQMLHQKNDRAEDFYCVLTGRIRVSNYSNDGKELVLTWIPPGHWFGEISLIDNLPRTHDAHAEEASTILTIDSQTFNHLFFARAQDALYISKLLCQRVRATFNLIDGNGSLSLKGQLCSRLSLMQQGLEEQHPTEDHAKLHISQDTLAQLLQSSRQSVNKVLQELQQAQIVKLGYASIQILDNHRLMALARI
ncbi:Crp/Fnr family transcriptional regulator [Paraglaciecola aestuariivivens]